MPTQTSFKAVSGSSPMNNPTNKTKTVPTCSKCNGTHFIHVDQEFAGQTVRLIFCDLCGTIVGTVIAL